MIEDYCGGRIPAPDPGFREDAELKASARAASDGCLEDFRALAFNSGLARVWEFVGALNRFIVRHEPWKMSQAPARRAALETILYDVAEGLRIVATLTAPVMPQSAQSLHAAVGAAGDVATIRLDAFHWGALVPGAPILRGAALFPRIDKSAYLTGAANRKERIMDTTDSKGPAAGPAPQPSPAVAPAVAPQPAAAPAEITIDDFNRVELRTAKILAAERVAGADRLLKLTVDVGTDTRTIVAGIATRYAPESLVGRTVVVVINLKPAKLRGVVSQGMVLAASDATGQPYIVTSEDATVPAGWRVK